MTLDDQHGELAAAWQSLFECMDRLPTSLSWDSVEYMDIRDMADRVRGAALHLDSAVSLARDFRYDSAFALTRTALEHCVIDWLVFLGRTFVQRISGVSDETWTQWQADRAAGADWTTSIRDWTRTKKGDVRIVREGLSAEPDDQGKRRQISIYYFLLDQYQPTLGPPSAQHDDGLIGRDELRRLASENEAVWRVYLTWGSLLTHLKENNLVDDDDAGRLATHYRFLSGYAHPVSDQRRATYGRDALMGWPQYDHSTSELVLLYALTIGVLELRNFLRSLDNHDDVRIAEHANTKTILETSTIAASHLWFLGTNPHAYDVWKARNELAFRAMRVGALKELPPEPAPEDVPYPAEPLTRLVAMHGHAREMMTGLTYISPWPRADAQFR